MSKSKKDKTVSIKLPEKTKRLIEKEIETNLGSFAVEALKLICEGLHSRYSKEKYNIKDYT